MYNVKERKIDMVANVATKAVIFPFVVNQPLIAPKNAPNAIAALIAIITAIHPSPRWFRIIITSTPTNANIEPTERSIPPAMIKKVIPNAMMPV